MAEAPGVERCSAGVPAGHAARLEEALEGEWMAPLFDDYSARLEEGQLDGLAAADLARALWAAWTDATTDSELTPGQARADDLLRYVLRFRVADGVLHGAIPAGGSEAEYLWETAVREALDGGAEGAVGGELAARCRLWANADPETFWREGGAALSAECARPGDGETAVPEALDGGAEGTADGGELVAPAVDGQRARAVAVVVEAIRTAPAGAARAEIVARIRAALRGNTGTDLDEEALGQLVARWAGRYPGFARLLPAERPARPPDPPRRRCWRAVAVTAVLGVAMAGGWIDERHQAQQAAQEAEATLQAKLLPFRSAIQAEEARRAGAEVALRAEEEQRVKVELALRDEAAKAAERQAALQRVVEALFGSMVTIPMPGNPFEIGKFEVTQGEWRAVMGNNPAKFQRSDRHPVESVSWNDVQDYLKRLNQWTGKNYRLPTANEWAYACRGEAAGEVYCGGYVADQVPGYFTESEGTQPVGQEAPNGFGLYDMSGNVEEWTCSPSDGPHDKCDRGPSTNGPRTVGGRGLLYWPATRNIFVGFRLARSL